MCTKNVFIKLVAIILTTNVHELSAVLEPHSFSPMPEKMKIYMFTRSAQHANEPTGDVDTPLDLHSKDGQFCVDISDFLELEWVEKEVEECVTLFEKNCEEKTRNVCLTVNDTLCEVSAKCNHMNSIKLGIGKIPANEICCELARPLKWVKRGISMRKLMVMASIWLRIRG